MPASDYLVFICGLPSSGNRVIEQLFKRAGCHTCVEMGYEADQIYAKVNKSNGLKPICVIPVRHTACRHSSIAKRWPNGSPSTRPEPELNGPILKAVADLEMPVYTVSYEAFVADPFLMGTMMLGWVEAEPQNLPQRDDIVSPWCGKIYDANEKWREMYAHLPVPE